MANRDLFTRIRKRPAALVAAGALVMGGLVAVPAAMAQLNPAGPYSIDGTVPDSGLSGITDPSGNSKELGPENGSDTKIGVINTAVPPMLGETNPNGQVDLNEVWLDTGVKNDDTFLYLAWSRDANKGSGYLMYEFQEAEAPVACDYDGSQQDLIDGCNPWANRAEGDFILVWDQQGNSTDIIMRTWEGPGPVFTLSEGVNLTEVGYAEAAFSADNSRGEAQVNLDASGIFDGDTCRAFANVIPGTVTGNSDTADYKDTVLTKVDPITNCGWVTISKVTVPAGDTDTSFTWTLDRADGSDINYDPATSATGTIKDGETDQEDNLIAGTNYNLVETDPGPAYAVDSIKCTDEGGTEYDVTPNYAVDPPTPGGDFPVNAGEETACIITNVLQPGTLTVNKVVENNWGGTAGPEAFFFDVSGPTSSTGNQFEGDGSNDLTVDQGTYNVTEVTPLPDGYELDDNTCVDIYVPAGDSASCTITNKDVPAVLTVNKFVDNSAISGNPEALEADDFAFSVTGSTPNATSASAVAFEVDGDVLQGSNSVQVHAGTYTATEDDAKGYNVNADDCVGVVVPFAGTAECTIYNAYPQFGPSGTTVQSWILKDSVEFQIRPGATALGDIVFRLYKDDAFCGATNLVGSADGASVNLDGTTLSAVTANGIAVTDPGDYYWTVTYTGDTHNTAHTTGCGTEITKIQAKDNVHSLP